MRSVVTKRTIQLAALERWFEMANSRFWCYGALVSAALISACNSGDVSQSMALANTSRTKTARASITPNLGVYKFGSFYWDTEKQEADPGTDHLSVMCPSGYPHAVSGGYEWADSDVFGTVLGSEPYGQKSTGWYISTLNQTSPPIPVPIDITVVCYNGK